MASRRTLALVLTVAVLGAVLAACGGRNSRRRTDGGPPSGDAGPAVDAGPGVDGGPGIDSGPPVGCTSAADCDDGLPCTRDECSAGTCTSTPDASLCAAGEVCVAGRCEEDTSCPISPCRIAPPQCGCSAGQACALSSSGTRTCGTPGSTPEGAECSGAGTCQAGRVCVGIGVALCHRACAVDGDCASGSLCVMTVGDVTPTLRLCNPSCNPVTSSGCSSNTTCLISGEDGGAMRSFTLCAGPVGSGGTGASCTGQGDCQRGHICGGGLCYKYCRPGFAGDCPSGYACDGADSISIGAVSYNICQTASP